MLVIYCVDSVVEADMVLKLGQYAEQKCVGGPGTGGDNATAMLEK